MKQSPIWFRKCGSRGIIPLAGGLGDGQSPKKRLKKSPEIPHQETAGFAFFRNFVRRLVQGAAAILRASEAGRMRVNGEKFFLLNAWADALCLLLAARLTGSPVRLRRVIPAALLGAAYAVFAWMAGPVWQGPAMTALSGLAMTLLALGKSGFRAFPGLLAAGFLFSGLCRYLTGRGAALWPVLLTFTAAAAVLWHLPGRQRPGAGTLEIAWRGQTARMPAMADSGNLLSDPVTGLPVVIVPRAAASPLLPSGLDPGDLASLPMGCRLIGVETAAGRKTLMCFRPDALRLRQGKRTRALAAVVAVSGFRETRALLPAALFRQEAEKYHAGF